MRILIIDTETTDLDPDTGDIIELGAALYDTMSDAVLWQYGTIVYTEKENKGEFKNKIPRPMIDASEGLPSANNPVGPIGELVAAGKVDVILAHNSDFDQKWFEKKFGVMVKPGTKDRIPWRCTVSDIKYPEECQCRKLTHLAVEHGITVTVAHRALADVLLTIELLRRVPDLEAQIQIALGPRALFQAVVSFAQKDLAKSRGYRWDPPNKRWIKKLPADTPLEPTEDRPFKLRRVG